jgi:hypothetical protein
MAIILCPECKKHPSIVPALPCSKINIHQVLNIKKRLPKVDPTLGSGVTLNESDTFGAVGQLL